MLQDVSTEVILKKYNLKDLYHNKYARRTFNQMVDFQMIRIHGHLNQKVVTQVLLLVYLATMAHQVMITEQECVSSQ